MIAAVAYAAGLAACGDTPEPAALPVLVPPPPETRGCGERGYLRTNFYGEYSGPVDWSKDNLDCEGMPRPNGEGARLRFAGKSGDLPLAEFELSTSQSPAAQRKASVRTRQQCHRDRGR